MARVLRDFNRQLDAPAAGIPGIAEAAKRSLCQQPRRPAAENGTSRLRRPSRPEQEVDYRRPSWQQSLSASSDPIESASRSDAEESEDTADDHQDQGRSGKQTAQHVTKLSGQQFQLQQPQLQQQREGEMMDSESDFQQQAASVAVAAARRQQAVFDKPASDSSAEQEGDSQDTDMSDSIPSDAAEASKGKPSCAAVAACARLKDSNMRITRGQVQATAQIFRCSGKNAAAAATEIEVAAAARPRRAAAAAAAAATAAALRSEKEASEQQLKRQHTDAGGDSDDYLGSPDASDAEAGYITIDSDSSSDHHSLKAETRRAGSNRASRRSTRATEGCYADSSSSEGSDACNESESDAESKEGSVVLAGKRAAPGPCDEKSAPGKGRKMLDLKSFRYGSDSNVTATDETQQPDRSTKASYKRLQPCRGTKQDGPGSGSEDCMLRSGSDNGRSSASPAADQARQNSPAAALAVADNIDSKDGQHAEDDGSVPAVLDPSACEPKKQARLTKNDDVERILAVRDANGAMQVLVKLNGRSYRAAVWVPSQQLEARRAQLLRNFLTKQATDGDSAGAHPYNIDPVWYQVDRLVQAWHDKRCGSQYLVKWAGLEYSDATWEAEEEVKRDGQGRAALARFRCWSTPPERPPRPATRPRKILLDKQLLPEFKNGYALRDYQETSLHWMINNYYGSYDGIWRPRNCILGDEMGLGKTAQSISVIAWLRQYGGVTSPCMVVAPLTTLGHWQREIETWTDLNVVLYAGSGADRQIIRETEFYYTSEKGHSIRKAWGPRFHVLLASYETIMKDKAELKKIRFQALMLDEAHRLKSRTSITRAALCELDVHWWLLLSGTPVQNNMKELQGLMSLLDHQQYGDLDHFLERFGNGKPTVEQICALREALAPVLLRRMKEDVEDLPEKEEVVIWVELTQEQRRYYRALYSKQIHSLLGGSMTKNLPGMRNLAMELRKLCCHPFLCEGVEEDMAFRRAAAQSKHALDEVEALTRASGKMLLLHKLLKKLRAEGKQVLIFSQFKIMLDVLEDYLASSHYPFERIDGDTKHKDRQAAIDRFMANKKSKTPGNSRATSPAGEQEAWSSAGNARKQERSGPPSAQLPSATDGSKSAEQSLGQAAGVGDTVLPEGPFVFLLSTRAGGQGITLTSANTIIIYDSDWNPQNDLQAMARCHRIGQDREVMVYRLVSKDTYEEQLFRCASRKYGLDEAILGYGTSDNPENDAAQIERLLREGAHIFKEPEQAGVAAGSGGEANDEKGMAAEDIEQILAGRSEKRQLGSRKGNTFSTATFAAGGAEPALEPEQDAKDFWAELLPEAVAGHEAAMAAVKEPQVLGARQRKRVDYREKNLGWKPDSNNSDGEDTDGRDRKRGIKRPATSDPDVNAQGLVGREEEADRHKKHKSKKASIDPELGRTVPAWTNNAVEQIERALFRYGLDDIKTITAKAGQGRPQDEVEQLVRALVQVVTAIAKLPPPPAPQAAATASAAAAGNTGAAAAAGDGGGQGAVRSSGSHGLGPAAVAAIREALLKAGWQAKLPAPCAKALLSADTVKRLGRQPISLLQQLHQHQQVHALMVKAGHAQQSSSSIAQEVLGTPSKLPRQSTAATPAPLASRQPISSSAAAAADAGKSPGRSKRQWVAPKVLLKGFKLPAWWSRDSDDRLVRGCHSHGYVHNKLSGIVEDILRDLAFGFPSKVALDPVKMVQAKLVAQAPLPAAAAPAAPPSQLPAAQLVGGDAGPAVHAAAVATAPVLSAADRVLLQQAMAQRAALLQAAGGGAEPMQLMGPTEWRQFVSQAVARLRKLRSCMLDPTYAEPVTPRKEPALQLSSQQPAMGAASGVGPGPDPAAQHKLQFNGATAKRPAPVGQTHGAALAAGIAAAQCIVKVTAGPVTKQQGAATGTAATASSSKGLKRPSGSFTQHNAASPDDAFMQPMKKLQPAADSKAAAAEQSQTAKPQSAVQSMQAGSYAAAAVAMRSSSKQPVRQQQQRQQPQLNQQQQRTVEVYDLVDDSPPRPGATGNSVAAALPAATAPGVGLVVRRISNTAEVSEEQSIEEAANTNGNECEAGTLDTPANEVLHTSNKQHMQQLLGKCQQPPMAAGAGTPSAAAEGHPVYGTPAGSDVAAGHKRKASSTTGTKPMKDSQGKKQRKLNEFFGAKGSGPQPSRN